MRDMGVGSWPRRRARMTPRAVALSHGGVDWTYADVERRATSLAHALRERGIERGDRIAYLGPNSRHFVAVMFAAAKLGAVTVPLNTRLAPPETAYILGDCGPKLLVWDAPLGDVVTSAPVQAQLEAHAVQTVAVPDDGPSPRVRELYEQCGHTPLDEPVARDDLFMIQYTSGTSGRPKGVMLTHDNIQWNVYNLLVDLDLTSSEVALVTAPLFHTAALNQLFLPTFLKGGRCLLEAQWDPGRALQLIETERVSFLFGVTSMYLSLTQHPGWEQTDLSSINVTMCGGSPIPPALLQTWLDRGQMLVQGYGLTESSPGLTMLRKAQGVAKAGSAGTPCFFSDVRVVGPMGEDVPVGAAGEVLGQGPNISPGYWRNPGATQEAFWDGGWLRTGDLGRCDDDGYLTIVDRVKDMIISGGENIYPAEVEAALHTHPAVAEAAVIAVPDERWGEVGRALVSLRRGADADEADLLAHLDGRIARYKIPASVVILDQLPHNAAGKILKGPLRAAYGTKTAPNRED